MLPAKGAMEPVVLKGFETVVVPNPHFRWGSPRGERGVC